MTVLVTNNNRQNARFILNRFGLKFNLISYQGKRAV